jgi:hypothetical protein
MSEDYDQTMAAYCMTLPYPLRQDTAAILWWDNLRYGKSFPHLLAVADVYRQPMPLEHATREEIIKALIGAGYTERNAEKRISSVDYSYNNKVKMREYRYRQRKKAERQSEVNNEA